MPVEALGLPKWAKRSHDVSPPDGWREVPLATIADIRFSSVDKKSHAGEKPVRLCNYTDVYNNDYIRGDEDFMQATASDSEIARFLVKPGDVIITKDSETPDDIGIPAVIEASSPDLLCGYHLALIRPKHDRVDSVFLAKQLAHERLSRYFARLANGLTRYGLPTAVVANVPLWVPPLGVQHHVAGILRAIDEAIAKTEALIAKLKQIKAGLLHDLLTRGLDDHGQLRDPAAHPEQFQETEIWIIPKGWGVERVKGICFLGRGRVISQRELQAHPGIYPVFSSQSEDEGVFGYLDTYDFEGEYVTWTTDGAYAGTVFYRNGKFNCTNVCGTLKAKGNLDMRYLALTLSSRTKRHVSYIGNPKLMNNVMAEILLPVPPFEEQQNISDIVLATDTHIRAEVVYLNKVKAIKKGLMHDLLTGRVRVPLKDGA